MSRLPPELSVPKSPAQSSSPQFQPNQSNSFMSRRNTVTPIAPLRGQATDSPDASFPTEDSMPINEDRGEALIRQRIRERKRDKRTKQRDNSDADASRSLISDSTEKPQSQSVSNPPMSASFHDNGKGVHGHAHFDDTKSCLLYTSPSPRD